MRRFVVIGQNATASGDFLLDDVPGTSGRLDVLLRCVRAATLYSHGLRRDVVVYLVLGGGPRAPRVVRIDCASAKFLRPDERSLATLMKKVLANELPADTIGFTGVRDGIAVARGAIDEVLADLHGAALFVLEEGAADLRDEPALAVADAAFFVGDHLGFAEPVRARLAATNARSIGVGPTSLHAEDAITIVSNELDRRGAATR